jgi:transposase
MGHSGYGRDEGERGEIGAGAAGDELAHVRARFAVDPATPTRLADAWSAPTGATEEDESEFVDAVADCLSVGLPLDAAVASWRAGTLQVTTDDDEEDEDKTDSFEDAQTGVFGRAQADAFDRARTAVFDRAQTAVFDRAQTGVFARPRRRLVDI